MNLQAEIRIEEFYWLNSINFVYSHSLTKILFSDACFSFKELPSEVISDIKNFKIFLGEHAPRHP